jgi:pimeloyl-ACP methyl ester carboxylesterase
LECARLDVPLDWTANVTEQAKRRAAVAVTRLPAKVTVADRRYGGAILINPGGPGGSGVGLVSRDGNDIQTIASSGKYVSQGNASESESEGFQYDVIGFDPRGVNNTTPAISCFPDDGARQFWAVQSQAQGLLSDNRTFPYVFGRTQALSKSCSSLVGNEEQHDVGRYVSTPSVVQDMVAIIETLGEWREEKAKTLLKEKRVEERAAVMERAKWDKGKEKLLYWGFSYGTLLGATFASMYPEKVGRLVLDGVCDAKDYYAGECKYISLSPFGAQRRLIALRTRSWFYP